MKPNNVVRCVIATLLAFVLALVASEASAQDQPVEGKNYNVTSATGARPITVEITRTANLDTKAFADIFKTDMFSIRKDNPTKTLAVCMREGNRASIASGISSEVGRSTDSVWETCPTGGKYVYIVPGVTLSITGSKYRSPDEEQAALKDIVKCEDAECVQKQLEILGSKAKVVSPSAPQVPAMPPQAPAADPPAPPPASSAASQEPQKSTETAQPPKAPEPKTPGMMRKRDGLLLALVTLLGGLIIGGLVVSRMRKPAKLVTDSRDALTKANRVPSTMGLTQAQHDQYGRSIQGWKDMAEGQRQAIILMANDWGLKCGPDASFKDATDVLKKGTQSYRERAEKHDTVRSELLMGLNMDIMDQTPLKELVDRKVGTPASSAPNDVMLSDAAALGYDLSNKSAQDAYMLFREKQVAAETELKARLRHYATELKIDGIPADASPILIAQNINDWCVKKNEQIDALLKEESRQKKQRQLMWDLFNRAAAPLGLAPQGYTDLHLIANDVVKRFSLGLDRKDAELATALVWLEGFFIEHPRLIKDLEDSKKAVIDLTPYKREVEDGRKQWRELVDATNAAKHIAAEVEGFVPTDDDERDSVVSRRGEVIEHTQNADTARTAVITKLQWVLGAHHDDLEEHFFGLVPRQGSNGNGIHDEETREVPAAHGRQSTLGPTYLAKVPSDPPPSFPRPPATLRGQPPGPSHDLTNEDGLAAALAALTPESVRPQRAPDFRPTPVNGAVKSNGLNGSHLSAFTVSDQNIDECIRLLSICSLHRPFVVTPARHAMLGQFLASKAECDPKTVANAPPEVQIVFLNPENERIDKKGEDWNVIDLLNQLEDLQVYPRKLTQQPPADPDATYSG